MGPHLVLVDLPSFTQAFGQRPGFLPVAPLRPAPGRRGARHRRARLRGAGGGGGGGGGDGARTAGCGGGRCYGWLVKDHKLTN